MNRALVLALGTVLTAGCGAAYVPPDPDFAFPQYDLAASVDGDGDNDGGTDDGGTVDDGMSTKPDLAKGDAAKITSTVSLTINEVNPRITGGADLIELLAHGAGSIDGFTLAMDIKVSGTTPTVVATLPAITVADGDFVLVHLKSAITSETTIDGCTDTTCVATAWDVAGSVADDLKDSARVLTLADGTGTIVDGFAYSDGNGPSTWPSQLIALQSIGMWDPTPCANTCSTTDADALAVLDGAASSGGVQTSVAGISMQRTDSVIPSTKAKWTLKASTWGTAN